MYYYTSTIAVLYSDPATLLHVEIPLKEQRHFVGISQYVSSKHRD